MTKPNLTPLQLVQLDTTLLTIARSPERFAMHDWMHSCGTPMCFAGHHATTVTGKTGNRNTPDLIDGEHVSKIAAKALVKDSADIAARKQVENALFYIHRWPPQFEHAYRDNADDPEARLEALRGRILHWLNTGE